MDSAIQLKVMLQPVEGHAEGRTGWHGTVVNGDERRVLRLTDDEAAELLGAQLEQLLLQAVERAAQLGWRECGR